MTVTVAATYDVRCSTVVDDSVALATVELATGTEDAEDVALVCRFTGATAEAAGGAGGAGVKGGRTRWPHSYRLVTVDVDGHSVRVILYVTVASKGTVLQANAVAIVAPD